MPAAGLIVGVVRGLGAKVYSQRLGRVTSSAGEEGVAGGPLSF